MGSDSSNTSLRYELARCVPDALFRRTIAAAALALSLAAALPGGEVRAHEADIELEACVGDFPDTTHRVSVDLRDADARALIETFAEVEGINVIVSDEVDARVTIRLEQARISEALSAVIHGAGLCWQRSGEVYLVTPG